LIIKKTEYKCRYVHVKGVKQNGEKTNPTDFLRRHYTTKLKTERHVTKLDWSKADAGGIPCCQTCCGRIMFTPHVALFMVHILLVIRIDFCILVFQRNFHVG
jgi:hypothetical protein